MLYYLGTEFEAPLTAEWSAHAPAFHVTEPEAHKVEAVRHNLQYPCIYYLGSSNGCGCGFRHATDGYIDPTSTEPPDNQPDHLALVSYLRDLPRAERNPQIFGCWSGDEALPLQHTRTCSISQLASPSFQFQTGELITLIHDD